MRRRSRMIGGFAAALLAASSVFAGAASAQSSSSTGATGSNSILPESIPSVSSRASVTSARTNVNLGETPSTRPMAVSLYANPYMNPWVNPMLMNGGYNKADLGWYLFAGQQATLGLGTGRLSGIRDEPRTTPTRSLAVPARVPAASARGYFQRGVGGGAAAGSHFHRGLVPSKGR
ncbi:MAG: hypothetical protein SFX72_10680 [Isosphaeraceae bacterium]|nr:hypothetical protein [Isosphaeraceae bacterium]